MAFSPDKISYTPVQVAPFILIYAPNGHGKTSFVLSAGSSFVIDTEDKYHATSVARYVPDNMQDVNECLAWLYGHDQGNFPGSILAIDTLDWLEKRIHEDICRTYTKHGKPASDINAGLDERLNFGKGSKIASNEFNSHILAWLEAIRRKHNIPIILCAQTQAVPIKFPDEDEYKVMDLRLDKILASFISDRVEAKMYIKIRHNKDHKGTIIPSNERYLVTERRRGIYAKNSLHLPAEITIGEHTGWNDFVKAIGTKKN